MVTTPTPAAPLDAATTISIDGGIDAPPADAAIAKLTCDPGTNIVVAPYPDPTWFCARPDGVKHGAFITLYPDESIEIEGTYKEGKLDGPWKRHFPSGAIAEQGNYVLGQRDGEWQQLADTGTLIGSYTLVAGTGTQKRWLDDGPLYSEVTLKAGVPHGAMKIYDRDGRVVISARYYAGKLDGDHVVGTRNTLRIEDTFKHGVLTGPRKVWQFWNQLLDETYDAKGKLDGTFTTWRDSGRKIPRVVGTYEHGKKIGDWVWTDKNNKVERKGAYTDGKKSGTWTEYSDGKLTFTGSFTDGKPSGDFIYADLKGTELGRSTLTDGTGTLQTYYPNKKPASLTTYLKGELSGKYEEYSSRGKTVLEGNYLADQKHGWWREYTELGVPVLEQHWKHGKLDGAVKKYEAGKLVIEATYKADKAEGRYAEYRDGKPSLIGQFAGDRRTGTWTAYDALGGVTLIATYKDGVLDGPWKQLVDGVVVEGTMVAGRRSGTWTRTDKAGQVQTTTVTTP